MLVDLHVKTSRSPGVSLTIDDVISRAAEKELDGIAICDHLSSTDAAKWVEAGEKQGCLLYTSPSPRDQRGSRMPSSA